MLLLVTHAFFYSKESYMSSHFWLARLVKGNTFGPRKDLISTSNSNVMCPTN